MTAATSTESTDVREAARRQAEHEGVSLGQWLDAAMLAHASRLGLTVSSLTSDQRVQAIMDRLPRPQLESMSAASGQLRTGTAGHGDASGSGTDEPGRETQTIRRAGMPAVAMLRESFEDTMVEDLQPAPPHASLATSPSARLDAPPPAEALSRADRVANAASRQAAQRMEIETKLNALFKALDRTPRRSDHGPANPSEREDDEADVRKQALLGQTAISPSWRLEKAVAEIAERQAFLERQTAAETLAPVERQPKAPRFGGPRAAAEDLRHQFAPQPVGQDPVSSPAPSSPEGVPSIFTSLQGDIARLARRLDDDAQQAARVPRIDPTIDLLGRRVGALSAKLDKVIERRAPDEAIDRLSQRIEEVHAELADRLTAAAAPALDMAGIEKLIHDLVERTDRPGRALPDMRGLEAAVHDLAAKIERAERSGASAHGPIAELQEQVGQLAQRIDRSDAGLNAIVAMERSLGDIFAQIRDVRGAAIEAAQSVARSAAEDAVRTTLANAAISQHGGTPAGTDPAVEQVSQELAELRADRDVADKRLHAILAALNTSLERVVDRLGALEQDAGGTPAAHPVAYGVAAPARSSDYDLARAPAAEERPLGTASDQPLDLDQPIEPGLVARQRLAGVQPAAPDAAAATPTPDPASFIAAARRAAQNAAQEHAARLDDDAASRVRAVPPSAEKRSSASRFRTGMLTRRRPLLLTLAGIVLLMGAAQIARMSLMSDEPAGSLTTGDITSTTPAASVSKAEIDQPAKAEGRPAAARPSGDKDAKAALGGAPLATTAPQDAHAPNAKSSLASTDPVPARQALPTMAMGPAASVAALKAADGATRAAAAGVIPAGLQAMADGGNAGAQFEVGLRHAEGRGVPRDFAAAASWFEKAARQGLAPAAYRLGSLYEKGLGVERDAPQSIAWYSKAAEAGNLRAMHNLAVMLAEGAVGKPDYAAAGRWFTKAAEGGIRDSQYNLAILSARGMGVEQNMAKAYTWFSLAAAQGDEDAAKKRDEVAGRLDAAALADARKAADTFKAAPAIPAANEVAPPTGGWDAVPAPSAKQQGSGNAHVSKL